MHKAEAYILFELAGATYGVRSDEVQHVEMLEHITPVPNTAPAVDGVVFSRGSVIPALNLRVRFGLPRQAATERSRLVFVRLHERLVALIVDSAREFRSLAAEAIRPMEETLHGISGNYVRGVTTLNGRTLLLLDLSKVLDLADLGPQPVLPASLAPAAS